MPVTICWFLDVAFPQYVEITSYVDVVLLAVVVQDADHVSLERQNLLDTLKLLRREIKHKHDAARVAIEAQSPNTIEPLSVHTGEPYGKCLYFLLCCSARIVACDILRIIVQTRLAGQAGTVFYFMICVVLVTLSWLFHVIVWCIGPSVPLSLSMVSRCCRHSRCWRAAASRDYFNHQLNTFAVSKW